MWLLTFMVSGFMVFGFYEVESKDEDEVLTRVTSNVTKLSNLDNTTSHEVTAASEVTASTIDNNEAVPIVSSAPNRTGHARMRPLEDLFPRKPITTTSSSVGPITEYDYWLYFTTPRRPRFSFRDFPGKPGVASWKEISPVVAKEDKKDHKSASAPTAAEVYNAASDWSANELTLVICIFSAILLQVRNLAHL